MLRLLIAVLFGLGLSSCVAAQADRPDAAAEGAAVESLETTIGEKAANGAPDITQELLDAAKTGDAEAQFQLGRAYSKRALKSEVEAAEWYRGAAEQGHVGAQVSVGYAYEYGEGVAENHGEALRWFRKAAEKGDARGQFFLGSMYELGKGVDQDYAVAMLWWHKAAEQGLAVAQVSLGLHYRFGLGVPRDRERALYWYRKAAEQGFPTARRAVGSLEKE